MSTAINKVSSNYIPNRNITFNIEGLSRCEDNTFIYESGRAEFKSGTPTAFRVPFMKDKNIKNLQGYNTNIVYDKKNKCVEVGIEKVPAFFKKMLAKIGISKATKPCVKSFYVPCKNYPAVVKEINGFLQSGAIHAFYKDVKGPSGIIKLVDSIFKMV